MKKVLCLAVLGIAFILSSCTSNHLEMEVQEDGIENISVTIAEMKNEDISSRLLPNDEMSLYIWEQGDVVGIFPSAGAQLEFPVKEYGQPKVNFDGGAWAMKRNFTYTAYYPFNFYNRNAEVVPFSYLGQEQEGNDSKKHLSEYMFVSSQPVSTDGNTLHFEMKHAGSFLKLELTMPKARIWSSLSVFTDGDVLPTEKNINLLSASLEQTVVSYSDRITIGLKNIETTTSNENIVVWIAFPSVSEASHPLYVCVRDSEGYAYIDNLVKRNSDGTETQAYASFTANKWQRRYASPVLQQGMNSGISDWEKSDKDYGGTVGG